ncbi:MAG TPA: tetratricopeptide repeat protein [Kofleriaceae bacterium]
MINRVTLVTILAVSTAATADKPPAKQPPATKPAAGAHLERDDLPGPQPEVAKETAKVDLPAIPPFVLAPVEAGFHGARELRVHGDRLFGTEVQVKGYITWIYNCVEALMAANSHASRAQVAGAVQKDPTLCERPKFTLGETRDTSRPASLYVVDVPRPPTKAERGAHKKSQLKGWWPDVPKLELGDYVIVTGTWALYSPHAEHNINGLVVYKSLEHLPAPPDAAPLPPVPEPEIDVVAKAPMRRPVSGATRDASVDQLNACNKAIVAQQFDAAIAACQRATTTWAGNHLAWYAWASAYMAKSEWQKARDTVEHAVALRPDLAMYQLYYGISVYEAELERVREEQARRDNKQPEEVVVDPALLKLDTARDALRRAVKLGPDLWRAHYYLGRVYRDLGDARHEAEQFSATITRHPSYRFGYIALIELYRRWSYVDEALAVAQLGTANVPPAEAPELWFEVGMSHDAKEDEDQAIEAFGKAIEGRPADLASKFQRGWIYFRRADYANARRDLDEVAKSADPSTAGLRPLASQMLGQMARKPGQ